MKSTKTFFFLTLIGLFISVSFFAQEGTKKSSNNNKTAIETAKKDTTGVKFSYSSTDKNQKKASTNPNPNPTKTHADSK